MHDLTSVHTWIVKTEPDTFSIDDLRKKGVTAWDGVRNYQARNNLRAMHLDDEVYIYHSSTAVPAIVGTGRVVRVAYPDPLQFQKDSPYYDVKSTRNMPRWSAVDIRYEKTLEVAVPLSLLRQSVALSSLPLLQKGTRLSVLPIFDKHATLLSELLQQKGVA